MVGVVDWWISYSRGVERGWSRVGGRVGGVDRWTEGSGQEVEW
jgi:hypothetical protein